MNPALLSLLVSLAGSIQIQYQTPMPEPAPAATETVLADRHWKIDHFPGGDSSSYPEGVYEVWPEKELNFSKPLGVGASPSAAVSDALRGGIL